MDVREGEEKKGGKMWQIRVYLDMPLICMEFWTCIIHTLPCILIACSPLSFV